MQTKEIKTMESKRVILQISDELHRKLKDYAKQEDRTLNGTLRKLLGEALEISMDAKKHRQSLAQAKIEEYRRLKKESETS